MNELEQYLAEEVAIDFRDGHISRREALHRLGVMGLGATVAATMLAACGGEPNAASSSTAAQASGSSSGANVPKPGASTAASGSAAPSASAARAPVDLPASTPTEAITFPGAEGRKLQGAWAAAEKPKGGVLVIHENRGLNDHTRHVAGRFAKVGYSALAIDLLSAEGGTATFSDEAMATAALGKAPVERHVADLRSALDEIAKRTPKVKMAAIGFCFGGGLTWQLIGTKDARLAAAAPFYGPFPKDADFTGAKTAVLGVYGEADARVNGTRDAAKAALEKAKLVHELVAFPGDHAFFNDTRERYVDASAKAAWAKVLDWYGKYLA